MLELLQKYISSNYKVEGSPDPTTEEQILGCLNHILKDNTVQSNSLCKSMIHHVETYGI